MDAARSRRGCAGVGIDPLLWMRNAMAIQSGVTRMATSWRGLYLLGLGAWLAYWGLVVPMQSMLESERIAQLAYSIGDHLEYDKWSARANIVSSFRDVVVHLRNPWTAVLLIGVPVVGYLVLRVAMMVFVGSRRPSLIAAHR
jgi:hypothetical protein